MSYSKVIETTDYANLRDNLSTSGVFDMTDCTVKIWCPEDSDVEEVQRMVSLIESMVHVTDVEVGSEIKDLTSENYRVVITEVKRDIRKKYPR